MRHLQLTHEQIAVLQKALGMAEKKFEDIHNGLAAMSRFALHNVSSYRKPIRKLAYRCG